MTFSSIFSVGRCTVPGFFTLRDLSLGMFGTTKQKISIVGFSFNVLSILQLWVLIFSEMELVRYEAKMTLI